MFTSFDLAYLLTTFFEGVVFDAIVFILTLIGLKRIPGRSSLMGLLFSQSILYFMVVLTVHCTAAVSTTNNAHQKTANPVRARTSTLVSQKVIHPIQWCTVILTILTEPVAMTLAIISAHNNV
jgi:hypothetical protein